MQRLFLVIGMIIILSTALIADEGMWLLTDIKDLKLDKKGLKIDPVDIYNPDGVSLTDAIVNLGGASAELVSPEGLLLTNHHVAFGAVQRASIKGDDYITKGFFAKNRDEEIPAPGSTARILKEMKDVTGEVLQAAEGIEDVVKKRRAIKAKIKIITEKIEDGRDDIRARIAEMYEGKQYILYVQQSFEDVRLVYVPPRSIGNYGADIDNWMWPRHTGDFAFLRIYVAPDGTGRKFNKENIPYKPKNWLKIAKDHLKDGDFTFIMGFPGSTNRYKTSYAVDYSLNHYYPSYIKNYKELIEMLEGKAKEDSILSRKVAGFIKGLNNGMKNRQGNIDAMNASNFLGKKQAAEKELTNFIKNDPELNKKYGDVLSQIGKHYEELLLTQDRDYILSSFRRLSGTLPRIANQIVYNANERNKLESERDPGFSEADIKRSLRRLRYSYMSFDASVDKMILKRTLLKARDLPESSRINGLEYIFNSNQSIDEYLDELYKNSKLSDLEYVKPLYSITLEELEAINDPMIDFAKKLYPDLGTRRKINEERDAILSEQTKKYIEALSLWKKSTLYPDANGTIRFTYGKVAGYKPRDAVYYKPFTTLSGVVEKDTGVWPFNVPDKLKELHAQKDFGPWMDPAINDVPVDFLHGCDITGGNSGSPVMNAKGELIGIAFDGNYEALTGDWEFTLEIQRTISVDIRYVMFVTEKFAGADYLLKEMGLK